MAAKFVLTKNTSGKFHFNLKATNHQVIGSWGTDSHERVGNGAEANYIDAPALTLDDLMRGGHRRDRVELAELVEGGAPRGIFRRDCRERGFELLLVKRRPAVERVEGAVVAEDRRLADLQVNVAGAGLNRMQEQGVQIHLSLIGSRDTRLERADAMFVRVSSRRARRRCARAPRSPSAAGARDHAPRRAR